MALPTPEEIDQMMAADAGGASAPASNSLPSPDEIQRMMDSENVDTRPSWADSAKFVGKSAVQGLAKTGDLFSGLFSGNFAAGLTNDNPELNSVYHPFQDAATKYIGLPNEATGKVADVVDAGVQAAMFPIGGPVANAASGIGGEIAHQLDPKSRVAPFIGALAGGGASSLADRAAGKGLSSIADLFGPQTEAGAAQKVGESLGQYVNPEDVTAGLESLKGNPLAASRTSAEVTQSPELAILEQQMGSKGDTALQYAKAAADRKDAAQAVIDRVSGGVRDIPTENSGQEIQNALAAAEARSKAHVSRLYDAIPKDTAADVLPLKQSISDLTEKYFGPGSPPVPASIQSKLDYILNADETKGMTLGELQNVRSHLADAARSAGRAGNNQEAALANGVSSSIRDTIGNAPEGASEWQAANSAMRQHAATFGEGPLSNITDSQKVLASRAVDKIMSSPESADQFMQMAAKNPVATSAIKNQIASDFSGMTDAQKVSFINNNESQLKTLLPDDFSALSAVRDDISSRIGTQKLANATGGSNTALKLSNVVQRALSNNAPEETSGLLATLAKGALKGTAGGTALAAAVTHPVVAIPAIAAGYGVKALRNRSAGLVQDALSSALQDPNKLQAALELASNNASPSLLSTLGRNSVGSLASGLFTSQAPGQSGPDFSAILSKAPMQTQAPDVSAIQAKINADPYLSALAQTESSKNPLAKNPKSSAKGEFQFIDSTAKALGVKDPLDLAQSYEAIQKLTEQNKARFGDDPRALYAAHYLGASLLEKSLKGAALTPAQEQQIKDFKEIALPHFLKNYAAVSSDSQVG